MAETWEIFGHSAVKKILEIQLASGKLSHAYLFRGPQAVGKKSLAVEFAKKILGTNSVHNHPDFSMLDVEGEITVEQVHDFMHGLSFKPFAGQKKVAIVNNAHNLNTQSGNALLKTLEEPSDSTIIILIASGSVLPTIISRCQTFYFYPAGKELLQEYAKSHSVDSKLLELSFGRLGTLQDLVHNPVLLKQNQDQIKQLKDMLGYTASQRLVQVSQFAELELPELEQLLQTWALWLRYELVHKPSLVVALQSCLDALTAIRGNLNKKLILQSLFLAI